MTQEMLLAILGYFGGALFIFFLGYLGWIMRRIHTKVENSISREEVTRLIQSEKEHTEKVIANEKEAMIKEIYSVKDDTRGMANSVLTSLKALEDRLDTLMLHLMNKGKE